MKLRLVLVEVEGAVNLGFIARLVENFDVDEFYLVNPKASLDEARRYAARASHRLENAVITGSLRNALEGATLRACTSAHYSRGRDMLRVAMSPWEFAKRAVGEELVALVMGRESTGLRRDELSECDVLVTIPASEKYRALNLSNATAILLYEIYKYKIIKAGWSPRMPPDRHRVELLLKYASHIASIVAGDRAYDAVRALRNLVSRAGASAEEVDSLLFLFSRIARRLGGPWKK
ncbi:MAG: rRNA methyltransferase [Desulfurococcales archaeon]|nr:rRNA methyltransferase [Desulfurococcales archaeon]